MLSPLTARQEECLRLTTYRTDKEIAVALGLSEATVKKHVHAACQRLGVNRRKAALALLNGLRSDAISATPPDLLAQVLSTAWVLAQVGASATGPRPEAGRSAC